MLETITNIEELEDIRKSIMRLCRTVKHAAVGAVTLDEKVSMQRLHLKMLDIDKSLKLHHFGLEDAINYAHNAETCEKCYSVMQKDE